MADPTMAVPDSGHGDRDTGPQIVPGLVWAFRIHPDGTAEELPVDQPVNSRHDGWTWIHLNLADMRAATWLETRPDLPAPARTLLVSQDRHQQLHAAGDCIYGVIADRVRELEQVTERLGHLRFVMTERLMITARRHSLHATEVVRNKLRQGQRLSGVTALLDTVITHVADAIDGLIDEIGTELDQIEDEILSRRPTDERAKLGRLRRRAVHLHRQLLGLRSLFHRLEREGGSVLADPLRQEIPRLAQRLDWLDHEVVAMRDRARLLQDEVGAKFADETNRHLNALTVLSTVLLPPTLLTGFFGMNTKDLPLAEMAHGSLWAGGIAVLSSVMTYCLFRWISRSG